jgi:hypothetical protein
MTRGFGFFEIKTPHSYGERDGGWEGTSIDRKVIRRSQLY